MGSGCSGRVWPQDVVTARPWGRAGGTAGTPLAPLPLSGTSCRTRVSPTGCWCRLPSFSSREQSDVPGRLKISIMPSKHWIFPNYTLIQCKLMQIKQLLHKPSWLWNHGQCFGSTTCSIIQSFKDKLLSPVAQPLRTTSLTHQKN